MGKEIFNKFLLVEGNDDFHIISHICEKYNIKQNFRIIDCEGIETLLKSISTRLKMSDIQTIGIVVDADTDIQDRREQIKGIFQNKNYLIQNMSNENGIIIEQFDMPKIGIWIMPDNMSNGMIEDFIKILIPQNDNLLPIAENILNEIENKQINQYKLIHKSKALIHTWLAWQEEPGTPMGLAITKSYLTTNKELCLKFVKWLELLFE